MTPCVAQGGRSKVGSEVLRRIPGGLELRLHTQPGASKSEFAGLHGDRLKVRIQAPAVEGRANEALRKLVAKAAGVPKSQVELVRGAASRDKDVRILWPENTPVQEIEEAAERFENS